MTTSVLQRGAVLLAEDDSNDLLLFRRAWARLNLAGSLQVVDDGDKAIAYLDGRAPWGDRVLHPLPSLLLLDLKMPRRSGFEVLAWIRGHQGLNRLPVVVFTSSAEKRDVDLAYELGANSYLVKPTGFDALVETLQSLWLYWLVLNQMPTSVAAY